MDSFCAAFSVFFIGIAVASENPPPGFFFEPNYSGNEIVYIIGDVREVLKGNLPLGTEETTWSAKGLVGFGAGAIGHLSGMGEAFYENGLAYVRTTDKESGKYFQTIQHTEFRSPFSLFVNKEATEDGTATYNPNSTAPAYTLLDFHQDVYVSAGTVPHCFYGTVKFKMMEGIAISRAPIYGEPLDGNYDHGGYYAEPQFSIANTESSIFGCAANYSTVMDPILIEKLKRALYTNSNDPGSASELLIHSHGLTVGNFKENTTNQGSDLKVQEEPGGVYHFVSNSTIQEIRVKVFKIDSAGKLQDLQQNPASRPYSQFSLLLLFVAIIRIMSE